MAHRLYLEFALKRYLLIDQGLLRLRGVVHESFRKRDLVAHLEIRAHHRLELDKGPLRSMSVDRSGLRRLRSTRRHSVGQFLCGILMSKNWCQHTLYDIKSDLQLRFCRLERAVHGCVA
jgi:hypothetical protein